MGEKLNKEDKEPIEKVKKELEEMVKKDDISKDDLEAKTKELQDSLMKVGEKIYSTTDANAEATTESTEAPKSEDAAQDVESTPKSEEEKK
jgi:hypothetical protein